MLVPACRSCKQPNNVVDLEADSEASSQAVVPRAVDIVILIGVGKLDKLSAPCLEA